MRTLLVTSQAGIYIPHTFAVNYGVAENFENWNSIKDDIEFLRQANAHEHEDYMEAWMRLEREAILTIGGTSYLVWDEDLWAQSEDADVPQALLSTSGRRKFWRLLCEFAYHSFSDLDISEHERDSSDEFDFAEALYWYCTNNHSGMASLEYLVLSNLDYKPSCLRNGVDKDENIFYMYGYTDADLERFLCDWQDEILEALR
jgi:hypothetical protein